MNAPLLPARQTFRQTVAEVAAKAKAILPAAVNGRIESAVKLVLALDVTPQADGSIDVGSSSDPLKTYRLVGTTCECQDFTRGQAPDGWCRHRIAAGIAKRVHELLPQAPNVETAALVAPPAQEPLNTAAADSQAPAVPLPEAPVSITLRATLHGHEVLVTLRGTDFANVQAQVEQAAAWLRSLAPTPDPTARPEGWCTVHDTAMKLNHGKDGRTWLSHRTPQGWCKGKGGRA